MDKFAIWAQLEAKPGKEAEIEAFLNSAQPLAVQESGTTTWYALKIGPSRYGIFDTFADENARNSPYWRYCEGPVCPDGRAFRQGSKDRQAGDPGGEGARGLKPHGERDPELQPLVQCASL
jgi:hypothetical protein